MILSAVVAMAENRVIGVDNDLPWHLPEDLQFFKETTKGGIMIMGRKTFESIKKPLPGRFHLVITRNPDYIYEHERVLVVRSLAEALEKARELIPNWPEEVFMVGGGEIYAQSMSHLDRIYLTRIHREYQGSAKFPEFENSGHFERREIRHGKGEDPAFDFETWVRKTH